VLDLSYQERIYLIEFINAKKDDTQKAVEQMQAKANANKKK
jgi:hypothetical protein